MPIQYLPGAFAARVVYRPDLRFTPSGQALATFTVATSQRHKDTTTGEWSDGPSTFVRVTVWRALAEHVAECGLEPGDLVVIAGDLELREWEAMDGTTRRDLEVTARTVGLDLARAPASVRRVARAGTAASGDPWASSSPGAPGVPA